MGGAAAASGSEGGRGSRQLGGVMVVLLLALAGSIATALPLFVDSLRERTASGPLVYVHVAFGCAFFVALGLKLLALGSRARPGRARRLWTSLVAQIAAVLSTYTLVTGVLVLVSAVWADQHLAASFWAVTVAIAHGWQYRRRGLELVGSLRVSRGGTTRRDRAAGAQAVAALVGAVGSLDAGAAGDRGAATRGRQARQRLVVVGTGMAGLAVAEEALRDRPEGWRITMLGEEPGVSYNRVLLSKLLAGGCHESDLLLRSPAWFDAQGVDLRPSSPAVSIDVERRIAVDARGASHPYEALVLATGSRPLVPPMEGVEGAHVFTFRTRSDVDRIAARASNARAGVVIGGGLLGLEAAAGLLARGVSVTVVQSADRLMAQQLDAQAAAMLHVAVGRLGMRTVVGRRVGSIDSSRVVLDDGTELEADLVVVAAGIRPETSLARSAGVATARGVVVDDQMRTSAPAVWAVGECAEHRGTVYGLWPPLAKQARVAAACAGGKCATFSGAVAATTLKVAGVDVFAGGAQAASARGNELVWIDGRRGIYRKLVLDDDRLAGALLVGDSTSAAELSELLTSGNPVPPRLLVCAPEPTARREHDGDGQAAAELVCTCREVSRAEIVAAIRASRLTTLPEVARVTGASTGCGGCARQVEALLAAGLPVVGTGQSYDSP